MAAAPATQVGTFHLDSPLARVFPMFTALGERTWARGWEPRILSGAEQRGSAFVTRAHDGTRVMWIVTEFRPVDWRVAYARLVQDSNIGLVEVTCMESLDGGTDVAVRYTLTALSEAGRDFIAHFLDHAHYARMMNEWREAITLALHAPAAR